MPDVHLYCDYWASVLGLQGVTSDEVQRRGLVDMNIFRRCLDRPETRLPGLRYYLLTLFLGPVLIPYRMVQRIASRLRAPITGEVEAAELLSPYRLDLEPQGGGRVDVTWGEQVLARDLVDPERPEVVFSLVYPSYKILAAALLAIVLAFVAHLVLKQPALAESRRQVLLFAYYPALAGLLFLIFRDLLTALVAPLPVFLVVWVLELSGALQGHHLGALAVVLAGLAAAYFVVDGVLVPRGLPPTLYLYENDPESPDFPYRAGQAPTWLEGRSYWVWRFMSLSSAELSKIWERDWERVEVWVRAEGPTAGQVEWVVLDFHYRELWLPRQRLVSAESAARQEELLSELRREPLRRGAWVVEVDMDVLFHSPTLRGLFLLPLEHGWRGARTKQLLASLWVEVQQDQARDYRRAVRRMLLAGHDVVADIPEHFRGHALRRLLRMPWRYWRYPRGANAAFRPYAYSAGGAPGPLLACEPELQIKAGRVPTLAEIAAGMGAGQPPAAEDGRDRQAPGAEARTPHGQRP